MHCTVYSMLCLSAIIEVNSCLPGREEFPQIMIYSSSHTDSKCSRDFGRGNATHLNTNCCSDPVPGG